MIQESRGHPHNGQHPELDENHDGGDCLHDLDDLDLADAGGVSDLVDGHPDEAENFDVVAEVDIQACPVKCSMV